MLGSVNVLVASRSWIGVSAPRLARLMAVSFVATALWLVVVVIALLSATCGGDSCGFGDS